MNDDRTTALDERTLRQVLDTAAEDVPPLTDLELTHAARAAAANGREHVLQLDGRRRAPARRSKGPARWALALVATLGLALAGGIGIGRNLAPAESAEALVLPERAPAFRGAEGWTVVESGIDVPVGARAVLAANVPLAREGVPLQPAPSRVLRALPPSGILVSVVARAAAERAPARNASRPLVLAPGPPQTRWEGPAGQERALAEYALATRVDGLDLDVRVYLGSADPSPRQLAAAQAQLDRLVVRTAANEVTLSARPTVVRWGEPVALSGAITGGQAGERVMIEVRECGTSYWRVVDAAVTTTGGQWFSETMLGISGALRARWGNATSAAVAIRARPGVILDSWRSPRTRISVVGIRSFWGKQLVLERFDRSRQRWVAVARPRVTESTGNGNFVWGGASFPTRLTTRGTLYRAVLASREAGPCYLAGFSNMVRR